MIIEGAKIRRDDESWTNLNFFLNILWEILYKVLWKFLKDYDVEDYDPYSIENDKEDKNQGPSPSDSCQKICKTICPTTLPPEVLTPKTTEKSGYNNLMTGNNKILTF